MHSRRQRGGSLSCTLLLGTLSHGGLARVIQAEVKLGHLIFGYLTLLVDKVYHKKENHRNLLGSGLITRTTKSVRSKG